VTQTYPTDTELTRLLARLTVEDRALLFERLREKRRAGTDGGAGPPPPLRRRPAGAPPPLSFAQQRLWFLDRLSPGDSAYNIPLALTVHGPLDAEALRRALQAVTARHESLRTTFGVMAGEPVQLISAPGRVALPRVDLSALADPAPETRRVCREAVDLPFDLAAGPLLRPLLVRRAPDEHVLALGMHHIVSDGWSMAILVRETIALYEAPGRPLPELPVQPADFAAWQREWLTGERLAALVETWKRRLNGPPEPLRLPIDRPRPPVKTSAGAALPLRLEAGTVKRVHRRARESGATPFMVLLAAFQAQLSRYGGQEDLVVGTPVAGRGRAEAEGLIGLFVNTLALRGDLSGNPSFRGLLAGVRTVALEAFAHQDLPFEKLVEELSPERDPSRTPLFQVMFALQNTPAAELAVAGLRLEGFPLGAATAKFDLELSFDEAGEELSGELTFSTDLFDAATAARMASHFQTLLAGALADPEVRLAELPLLGDEERRQLLLAGDRTGQTPEGGVPLPRRFEDLAAAQPERDAVIWDGGSLSYGELNRWANRLARRLRALGVVPETRVAVCLERSPELIAALFGVLKAGGVYIPLDPAYPRERLELLLADSRAAVLVTREGLVPLPAPCTLLVDADRAAIEAEDASDLGMDVDPRSLAYVLYTSGSTGRPKGVGVEHATVAAHFETVSRIYDVRPGDRILHFASPSFDVAIEQVLLPLTRGATTVLRGPEPLETRDLAARIAEWGLTMIDLPTAYWRHWASDLPELASAPPRLRLVLLGGEEMSAESARLFRRSALAGVRLLNGYGPTEAVVTATVHEVGDEGDTVPIGRPLPGRSAHVLDRAGHLAPLGAPGELALGGLLARGYLGAPVPTAERFVPDSFSGEPGARLYRTGDLALRRPNGELEFLGRIDGQVKIRGFRIEIGEVEAALTAHPDVRDAVVAAPSDRAGGRRLAAFLVPRPGAVPSAMAAAGLRAFLEERLPGYMVPSSFTVLDALPLTPHGKVDRQALDRSAPEPLRGPDFAPPATETERAVAGLWTEVLGVERVGVDDSFFDLGGHSLLLARLQTLLAERLGRDLPLLKLIEHPTVRTLARWLEGDEGGPAERSRDRGERQRQSLQRLATRRTR
jgi:amino acid adenylation domain-containing protein